ncbi:tyrosinase [Pseudomonas sp. ok272]|uniref:tyrosinase family protein n=1 Tax=unclassified Pseudomonas TaxID=196821 RepID=UPI0008D4B442|nr:MULTISPECIES: tyrosinase family protein [unclassified Pseudomonas]SEN19640.1 tyrosinase [Pseudomonas sp. ok272]SFN11732.1 tyrosinase [Pseudomonas sp. ok602]
MDIRPNYRNLSPQQKQDFIQAILTLKNDVPSVLRPGQQTRYDDFAEVHKNAMVGPNLLVPRPHGGPLFYPWHRVFLREFEIALQSASGRWDITLPYWDWDDEAHTPFTEDFLGGSGNPNNNDRVESGPFAYARGQFEVRVWEEDQGDPGLRRRSADASSTLRLPTEQDVNIALTRTPYWSPEDCWEKTSELNLHSPPHAVVGGNMLDPGSPNDPVFFLHHCNLDRLWERWKRLHPGEPAYLPAGNAPGYDLNSTLTFQALDRPAPWPRTFTVQQTLDTMALGYLYA